MNSFFFNFLIFLLSLFTSVILGIVKIGGPWPGVHVLYFPHIDTLPHKVCSPTPRHANHNFARIFPAQLVVTKDYESAFDTVTLIYISLKWTVSLADLQPLSIAKTYNFRRKPRFHRRIYQCQFSLYFWWSSYGAATKVFLLWHI